MSAKPTDENVTELHVTSFPHGVPISLWGRDHITTLLYAECRAVDHRGKLDDRSMRTDRTYPTRLRRTKGDTSSTVVIGHTDYDCLLDAVAVGFIKQPGDFKGSFAWANGEPVVFTDEGWAYVHGLRRARAEGVSSQEGTS